MAIPTQLQKHAFKPGNKAARGNRGQRRRGKLDALLRAKMEDPDTQTKLVNAFEEFLLGGEPWAWGMAAKLLRWDRLTPDDDMGVGANVVQLLQRVPPEKKRMLKELAEQLVREEPTPLPEPSRGPAVLEAQVVSGPASASSKAPEVVKDRE